jgi:hypothetical protein
MRGMMGVHSWTLEELYDFVIIGIRSTSAIRWDADIMIAFLSVLVEGTSEVTRV